MKSEIPLLREDGKRLSGRGMEDLRPIRIVPGVLSSADGSAYVEWGKNKVICGVFGPRECLPKHEENPYRAIIRARYTMSPFASLEDHGRTGPNRRSTELSKVIKEVFENVVMLEKFPRTQIDIFMDVLQADGGTRVSAITAASVALADAGIPMKGLVGAVAMGKAGGKLIVDLDKFEDNYGQSDVALAIRRGTDEVLLLQMDGMLTKEEFIQLFEMGQKAANKVGELQKEALIKGYEEAEAEGLEL